MPEPDEEPPAKPLSHTAAARIIDVPARLLEIACECGAVSTVRKHASHYFLDPHSLPTKATVISAVRAEYRAALERTTAIADSMIAEVEAVQFDARDALEHATDPVGYLGDDLVTLVDRRWDNDRSINSLLSRLRLAAMNVTALQAALRDVDEDRMEPLPLRARRTTGPR